jgi:hypothetical protein
VTLAELFDTPALALTEADVGAIIGAYKDAIATGILRPVAHKAIKKGSPVPKPRTRAKPAIDLKQLGLF